MSARITLAALALLSLFATQTLAQEEVIRKNLAARLPNLPAIDEITKTPIPGLYEVRIGTEIFYSDERGDHWFEGHLIETKSRTDLTQARIDKLTAIDVASLPLKDAVVWRQGSGARKLYVFADPNCGYCKQLERELSSVKDITVYTFLYPILGGDSPEKSRNIWCARDGGRAWRDWMVGGIAAPPAAPGCDAAALARNAEFGRKHRINGTPAIVFEDGKRVPGAMRASDIEKQLLGSLAAR